MQTSESTPKVEGALNAEDALPAEGVPNVEGALNTEGAPKVESTEYRSGFTARRAFTMPTRYPTTARSRR